MEMVSIGLMYLSLLTLYFCGLYPHLSHSLSGSYSLANLNADLSF